MELLDDQYARLDQAGSTPETGIALARIFIDVAAATDGSPSDEPDVDDQATAPQSLPPEARPAPGLLSDLLAAAPQPNGERIEPTLPQFVDAVTPQTHVRRLRHRLQERPARYLVIGGPGQGKSTLTQYLCQLHRHELLRAHSGLLPAPQRQALDLLKKRAAADGLPWPQTPCLPLRVILRDFAAWMFRGKVEPRDALIRFVADRMARALRTPVEPATVEAALSRVPWLLVLDGLDEVPISAGRAEILNAVRAMLESPVARSPHLVVATTRPQGYAGELGSFERRALLGLSRTRALTYAARLVEARYTGQATRQEEILERLASAWDQPASRRLMRTPLQISVMAALVAQVGRAPADRWRLFSDYYRVMYQREIERPNLAQAELLRDLRRQIDEMHRLAGLWLQTRSEQAGETDALLSREELAQLIDAVLERNGHDDADERRALVDQLFEAAVVRLVFLVHAQEGKYGFEIRSLQELMAAEALLTGGDAEVKQRLRHIAPLDSWRNVLLFAAGKCFAEMWHLAPVIVNEICPWLNKEIGDPAVYGVLTGSEIALDLIEDGAARNQPKLARSLIALALRLLELPPLPIHDRLAGVGFSEFKEPLRQALESRLSLPEPERRLSAWVTLVVLADADVPGVIAMADSRWPSDGKTRREIVEAVDQASVLTGRWLQARMADSLGDFPPELVRRVSFEHGSDMPLGRLAAARPDDEDWLDDLEYYALFAGGKQTDLSVRLLPHNASTWELAPFLSMSNPPPSWLPLVIAARFVEAPSASNLAKGLQELAEAPDPEAWADLRWDLPWPLAQALSEARDPDALRALAGQIESGACGDQPDWEAAETAWREQGVSFESLLTLESAWPIAGQSERAFPFNVFGLSWQSSVAWNRMFLDQAIAAYRQASRERRPLLAHIVTRFVSAFSHSNRAPGALEPEEIREVWSVAFEPARLRSFLALAPEPPDVEQWLPLANDIGNMMNITRYSFINDNLQAYKELAAIWYVQSPRSTGLLRLIAGSLRPFVRSPEVPTAVAEIDPDSLPVGSMPRFHAAILRLVAGPDSAVASSILAALIDSLPADPEEASLARLYVEPKYNGPSLAPPSHLAELLARLPWHAWRLGSTAVQALLDHRKRRRSALDDAAEWNRLGFPLPQPVARTSSAPTPASGVFRVLSATFSNLRPFDRIEIELASGSPDAGQWLVFIGENGVGKSTLLRGLCFSLADSSAAASALGKSLAPYRGAREAPAKIEVRTPERAYSAVIALDADAKREMLLREPKNGGHRPFLVAYGCQRGSALGGPSREVSFAPEMDIGTLFDEARGLAHAETWLTKLEVAAQKDETGRERALTGAVIDLLKEILHVDAIDIEGDAVWVESIATGRARIAALSDGYLTTTGWIVDMIARFIDRARRIGLDVAPGFNETMEGVVLVDEIDLHLHPRWQVRVIDDLRRLFPRMTFVVTTHNPLTLLGARPGEVFVLRRSEVLADGGDAAAAAPRERTRIEACQQDIPPGLTMDQVLTGAWFGLASTLDKDTLRLLEEHRSLLRDGVGRDDPKRLALEEELRRRLGGFADTSLERLAQSVAAKLLPKKAAELGPEKRVRLKQLVLETVAAEAEDHAPPGGAATSPEK